MYNRPLGFALPPPLTSKLCYVINVETLLIPSNGKWKHNCFGYKHSFVILCLQLLKHFKHSLAYFLHTVRNKTSFSTGLTTSRFSKSNTFSLTSLLNVNIRVKIIKHYTITNGLFLLDPYAKFEFHHELTTELYCN